jgi:hypothetical protein
MLYDRARTAARIYNITVFEPMFTVVRECKFRERRKPDLSQRTSGREILKVVLYTSIAGPVLRDMIAGHYMLIQEWNNLDSKAL